MSETKTKGSKGETTVRISKATLRMLERLRQRLGARTLDDTIRLFIAKQRRERLSEVFGADTGRLKPFGEDDRGEDSSCN